MTNCKLPLVAIAVISAVVLLADGCRQQALMPGNSSSGTNTSAPRSVPLTALGWTLTTDERMTLADFKGKVVLLDFYATWCEPCRAETPRLVQLQQQYSARGLQVIGLNVGGEDDREEVPAFAKEFRISYPLGFPDDILVDQFLSDNQNIPQVFVLDRDGVLLKRFIGYDADSGELETVVQAALAARTASDKRP